MQEPGSQTTALYGESTLHPRVIILKRNGLQLQAGQGKEGAHAFISPRSGLCALRAEQRRAQLQGRCCCHNRC